MAFIAQTFTPGTIITAAQHNQQATNIAEHDHTTAGQGAQLFWPAQTMTLASPWAGFGAPFDSRLRFSRALDSVKGAGLLRTTASVDVGSVITTVPADLRPVGGTHYMLAGASTTGGTRLTMIISISTAGALTLAGVISTSSGNLNGPWTFAYVLCNDLHWII